MKPFYSAAAPEHLNIACAGIVALLRNKGGKLVLVNLGVKAYLLPFLNVCADLYH